MRREAELIDIDEFRRLLDAALEFIAAFERAGFRRHQPEHDLLALRHETQRLETAGTCGVEFHEIAMHADRIEQPLGDRLVAARRHEGRAEIAAAQMHRHDHVGGNVRDGGVDHAGIDEWQGTGIVAPGAHLIAQGRIAQIGEVDLVELQVTAPRVCERAHDLTVGSPEVAIEIVHGRINRFRHRLAAVAEMQRRRRRDRHLGCRLGVPGNEAEMVDHRVAGKSAEFAL